MDEKKAVQELGEQIGYGNMMHLASECWQESLKSKGLPAGGAFSVGLPYDLLIDTDLARCEQERDRLREYLQKISRLRNEDAFYVADVATNLATKALESEGE